MRKGHIRRMLGWQYRWFLFGSFLVVPLLGLVTVAWMQGLQGYSPESLFRGLGVWLLIWLVYLGGIAYAVWRLQHLERHADLVKLARYGPLDSLLAEIEGEMSDKEKVTRVGQLTRSLRMQLAPSEELGQAEVDLTSSWLVYLTNEGCRMKFFRLDSLVWVYRQGQAVVLADRHDERLRIPGTDAGLARLMAEILVRVPWALNHFDAETERTWNDNPQQIIAAAEQRRREIQTDKP